MRYKHSKHHNRRLVYNNQVSSNKVPKLKRNQLKSFKRDQLRLQLQRRRKKIDTQIEK